jgi:hypothetical protein
LSTAVRGFKSGKVIDDCEYLQVKGSNKCPEGDLPTRDTHLRHLAPGLAKALSTNKPPGPVTHL